jgi:hypothetical protein
MFLLSDVAEAAASATPTGDGWARGECPYCDAEGHRDTKRNFAVKLDSGYWCCWRCERNGWLDDVPEEVAQKRPETRIKVELRPGLPDGSVALASRDGRLSISFGPARKFLLEKRTLTWDQIEHYRVHACLDGYYAERIIFPVLRRGETRGFVARAWGKADRSYLYPRGFDRGVFYNGDALDEETDQPLFVVEGIFDALRVGTDAVACLGKPTGEQVVQLKGLRHRPVVVAMDSDAWRTGSHLAMSLRLHGVRSVALRLPPGEDPDSLSSEWIREKAADQLTDL